MTEHELQERTAEKRDLSNYRVVRGEFISSPDEVQVTFNRGRMYINSFGLSQFPKEDFIHVLVDEDTKSAVIKPSVKKKRDGFRWCGGIKKRKPRHISCVPLCYLIFRMMNWDWEARYRITGEIEDYGEERVIFLDLKEAVCFVRGEPGEEGGRSATHMKMPAGWAESFGLPYEDYSTRQDIKTFDDVSVFDVELLMNKKNAAKMQELKEAAEESPETVTDDKSPSGDTEDEPHEESQ